MDAGAHGADRAEPGRLLRRAGRGGCGLVGAIRDGHREHALPKSRRALRAVGAGGARLSILGAGDSQVFAKQARAWHAQIRSTRKVFVELDAASGADGHVQVNNRLRLCQECVGWMDEIFDRSQA